MIERLARSVERTLVAPGAHVVVEGDPGDRFHLVVAGHLVVTRGDDTLNRLEPGRSFGELALLHDAPRAATVTAVDDVELLSLARDPFLEAVTGHSRSLAAATRAATAYR
ncbi:MAG: cyclic nucleotide-binding domain-containing protein [Ilumatobacteraceae bacterium]